MASRSEQLDNALRRLHTPETFGRAILDAALRASKERGETELEAKISVSVSEGDESVPVCFFLFNHEICVSLPFT